MAKINPYLGFNGNCEEAFNFYKSVFGGEFAFIQRFKDVPKDAKMPSDESGSEKIMHVSLPIGATILMGSDMPQSMGGAKFGDNISISVAVESESEADKILGGLASGGKVTMSLEKTFWNAYFGMCVDKFGINWMVSYEYGKE